MKWQQVQQNFWRLMQRCLRTTHSRIVSLGLLVGIIYSPFWVYDIVVGTIGGASSLVLLTAAALGTYLLWQKRKQLADLKPTEDDRWLGHAIVLGGLGLTPFFSAAEWSQRLLWMVILVGIVISSWGIRFFRFYPAPTLLITMGLFPKPGAFAEAVWQTFVPARLLNELAAWGGAMGLKAIGQPAELDGATVALPGGAVKVVWGCNGFSMAITLAAASIILGLFFNQRFSKVVLLIATGVAIALIGNIPRIMLMALAEAYWGKAAFEFWHGPWGGQIFATILLTIYYYVAMAIVNHRPKSQRDKSEKSNTAY